MNKAKFDGREFFGLPEIGEKYTVTVENEDKSHCNQTGTVVEIYPKNSEKKRFARLWVQYPNGSGFFESYKIRPELPPQKPAMQTKRSIWEAKIQGVKK